MPSPTAAVARHPVLVALQADIGVGPEVALKGIESQRLTCRISDQTQNAQATSASLCGVEVKIKGRPRSKAAALILVNKGVEMENPDTTYIPQ